MVASILHASPCSHRHLFQLALHHLSGSPGPAWPVVPSSNCCIDPAIFSAYRAQFCPLLRIFYNIVQAVEVTVWSFGTVSARVVQWRPHEVITTSSLRAIDQFVVTNCTIITT